MKKHRTGMTNEVMSKSGKGYRKGRLEGCGNKAATRGIKRGERRTGGTGSVHGQAGSGV